MDNVALAVDMRGVGTLVPHPTNARTHPRRQIEQIKASILKHGFVNPILVDRHSNIIAGHGRLIAARELGMVEVPVIVLPHLSEGQVRALRLADNKIALGSGWDADLLRIEITELAAMEIELDFSSTGFSEGEINVILNPGADPDDDILPDRRSEPRTVLGDVWELNDHRVGCGDGRDPDFLRRVVGKDEQVDCAFLDAPYNVKIQGHANVKARHREFAMASGEMTVPAYRAFLTDTFGACVSVSRNGAVHFLCMDWRHADDLSAVAGGLYGEQLNLCIWNKSNAGMGSLYRDGPPFSWTRV